MTTCTTCGQALPSTTPAPGREWTVRIDKRLRSVNEGVSNKSGTQWQRVQYAKDRDEWGWWLMVNARHVNKAERREDVPGELTMTVFRRRTVTITRLYSGREREMDERNIDTKALVDSMVRAGLLVDDSPRWLTLEVTQERAKESGVRIRIQEA